MSNKESATPDMIAKVADRTFTNTDFQQFLAAVDPNIIKHFMGEKDGFKTLMDEMVNQELMLLMSKDEKLEEEEDFKRAFEKTKENLLKNYAYEKIMRGVSEPTEEEAKVYYEKNRDSFKKPFVNASHILVKSSEEAENILNKIYDGESFEKLAEEFSTCPSGKSSGGNLGDFTKGQMVPEFDAVVFKMEEGQVEGPIKTQFGYHIIRLNKINSVQEADFEASKREIMMELKRQRQLDAYQTKLQELKEKYKVELFI
ncbi:MAG: peptidylprolyl isomerase [Tissierellia bacterium]|nr:peptidylprolyl isomerase [Tissierellia bacterium]